MTRKQKLCYRSKKLTADGLRIFQAGDGLEDMSELCKMLDYEGERRKPHREI